MFGSGIGADAVSLTLLVLAVIALLYPFFFGDGLPSLKSGGKLPADDTELYYPLFQYLTLAIDAGRFPLWCPDIYAGFPRRVLEPSAGEPWCNCPQ